MGKVKLSDSQRASIRELHKKKGVSVVGLSNIFGVSRATIRFVLNPHLEEQNRERNKLRMRKVRKENGSSSN